MIKLNHYGGVNGLLFPLVFCVLLLFAAIGFGVWANNGRAMYKNNVDVQIATAVASAKQRQVSVDQAQFAIEEKSPLSTYTGPEAYGSLVLKYPKTWSGYVDDTGNGSALVDGYFSPQTVPSINASSSVFALRVQVENQPYSSVIQGIASQETNGTVTAKPYALPKVPQDVGLEVTGQLNNGGHGTEVILPIRNYTLAVWTQGSNFLSDFNTYVLPNLSFSP
jgi:hypothetical protein